MDWDTFAQLIIGAVVVLLLAYVAPWLLLHRYLGTVEDRLADLEARVSALEGETPPPEPGRSAPLWPFQPQAFQNHPIGSGLTYTDTGDPRTKQLRGFGSGKINSTDWSYPVYIARPEDPWVDVTEYDNNGNLTGDTARIQLRADAVPAGPNSTDKPLLAVDVNGVWDYEIYKFTRTAPNAVRTTRLERVDLTSDGSGTGAIASSTPAIGGLIRVEELAACHIPHMLKISAPDSLLKSGYIWPARSQDANHATAYTGTMPMGTMLAIPPNVDLGALGLSPEGLAIGRALQDYGGYLLVRASTVCVFVDARVTDAEAVKRADADYRRLIAFLVVCDGSVKGTPGGPGTPRVPLAPPLEVAA